MKKNLALSKSIQDKNLEVHYNKKHINTSDGQIPIKLQGKIQCPLLNSKITPIVCAKFMESDGWPRKISPDVCSYGLNCYIYKSIQKNMTKRGKNVNQTKK